MKKLWRPILMITGVMIGVLIAFAIKPPEALSQAAEACSSSGQAAMTVIGTVVCAVFWWIAAIVPDWIVGLSMLVIWTLTDTCSFSSAFSQYGSSTVWLLIGAFSMAGAVVKTGALRRISLLLMRLFRPTFKGQTLSLMVVGTVISPLLPSATAKGVLGANMATATGKSMQYEPESNESAGVFSAAWTGFYLTGPCFMSASAFGYIILEALPADAAAKVNWLRWLVAMLPWSILMLVGMYFAILLIYKPKNEKKLTKEYVANELHSMGSMSKNELLSLVIIFLCLICWIFESKIGISAAVTSVVGLVLCFALHILEPKEIATRVPWTLIIFTGSVMQMGSLIAKTGVSAWLRVVLFPVFSVVGNKYLLVVLLIVFVYIIRFVLVSQAAVLTLFIAILYPIVGAMGISPFILGMMVFTSMSLWIIPYQNSTYVAALGAADGYVKHSLVAKSSVAYCIVGIAANLLSIPFWSLLGYIN